MYYYIEHMEYVTPLGYTRTSSMSSMSLWYSLSSYNWVPFSFYLGSSGLRENNAIESEEIYDINEFKILLNESS